MGAAAQAIRACGLADGAGNLALLDRSESEWAALEAENTIGETFFFRYAEQFAALRETILPERIAARADERRLRIWSAGCSTGAETYSLAILLRELLGERLPDWRIGLTGTDINHAGPGDGAPGRVRRLGDADAAGGGARPLFPRGRPGVFRLRPEFRSHRPVRGPEPDEPPRRQRLAVAHDYDLILCAATC